MELFEIKKVNSKNKKRNLDIKASGVVSSTKYFPVFKEVNKEMIFKPLSKTKPFSTPLFSYSEVYWSYLLKKYMDFATPQYQLAYCEGLEMEQPKYYEKGCLVENVLQEGEKLINLLEYFKQKKDPKVSIDDYINYCEVQYDYEPILRSNLFTNRKDLGQELAKQILCSILRRDDNYHYENVSMIIKDGQIIKMAPMMDLEFSEFFMFPDFDNYHNMKKILYEIGTTQDVETDNSYQIQNIRKNLKTIVELYPEVVENFLERIILMKEEVMNLEIKFENNFLGEFSSIDWIPTRMIYKEGKKKEDKEYIESKEESEKSRIVLEKERFNEQLKKEVLESIELLSNTLRELLETKKVIQKKLP